MQSAYTHPSMSDIVRETSEPNIKPEEEKVPDAVEIIGRSGRGFGGLSRKGLFAILAMLLLSTALSLGIGLHFVAANKVHAHKRGPVVVVGRLQSEDLLSDHVQPL